MNDLPKKWMDDICSELNNEGFKLPTEKVRESGIG